MSASRYQTLIDRICEIKNISDPTALYETANLDIDGIPFMLLDGAELEADSVLFFCDFGPIPDHVRFEAMQRLLELNLVIIGPHSPRFSLNQESGHVLLTGMAPLDRITPDALMDTFERYAREATQWRKTCFLGDMTQDAFAYHGEQLMHSRMPAPGKNAITRTKKDTDSKSVL